MEPILEKRIKEILHSSPVMLFMKGDKFVPKCGFSAKAVEILDELGAHYITFDVLEDEQIRQGLKEYSNWPTYPQLYIKGELIGGIDIIEEMVEGEELQPIIESISK